MISECEIKDIMLKIMEEKENNMNKMHYTDKYDCSYVYFEGQNKAYTTVYKLLKKVVYGDE